MRSIAALAADLATALFDWFEEVGRRRGQAALNRIFGDDDFDEIQDVFPDARRVD